MSGSRTRPRRILVTLGLAITMLLGTAVVVTPAEASTPSRATALSIARSVLRTLNAERAHSHLPPLRMNAHLVTSAHRHNVLMAQRNTMSHQLRGEAFFATRITRAGYRWSSAGENIAWNSDWRVNGALAVQRYMYNERPPNDGHRRNILSRSFRDVGIDIYMDAKHHKLWMTEDFGRSR
jgi:uncharacterized protein YkwD